MDQPLTGRRGRDGQSEGSSERGGQTELWLRFLQPAGNALSRYLRATGVPTPPKAAALGGAALLSRRVWGRGSLSPKSPGFGRRREGGTRGGRAGAKAGPGPPRPARRSSPGVKLPKGKRGSAWHVLRVPGPEAPALPPHRAAPSPRPQERGFWCNANELQSPGPEGPAGASGPASTPTSASIPAAAATASRRHNNGPPPAGPRAARGRPGRTPPPSAPRIRAASHSAPAPPRPNAAQRRPLPPPGRKALAPPRLDFAELIKQLREWGREGLGPPARARAPAPARVPRTCPLLGSRARAAAGSVARRRQRCPRAGRTALQGSRTSPKAAACRRRGGGRRSGRAGREGGEPAGGGGGRERGGRRGGRRREARK